MKLYMPIQKIEKSEDGTLIVIGVASSEAVDADGEIIKADAMRGALPEFFKYGTGNLREMHQPSAAGTVDKAEVGDDGCTYIEAHVVDPVAIKKIEAGVYKGFSIGGKVTSRDVANKNIIDGLRLVEISLVDRPSNSEAVLTMYKAEGIEEEEVSAVDQLADLLNKGEITPEKLLELAKGGFVQQSPVVVMGAQNDEALAIGDALKGAGVIVVDGVEVIEKGMYSLQEFASVLMSLGWMCESAQYESDWEGDNSPIPAQLRAWLVSGIQIFKDMAAEETAELVAQLKAQAGEVETLALAAKTDDLAKSGAKFSKATKGALGAIHKAAKDACEHLEKLGYEAAEEIEEADKSAAADDLAKAAVSAVDATAVDLKKAAEALGLEVTEGQLYSQVAKAAMEHALGLAKRVKELEDKPAPGKALLKAISKGGDVVDAGDDTNKVEPVKDHKGDVNDVATLIKAIHSGKV